MNPAVPTRMRAGLMAGIVIADAMLWGCSRSQSQPAAADPPADAPAPQSTAAAPSGGARLQLPDFASLVDRYGKAVVNVSVAPTFELRPDEPVFLEFDQNRMHLFDGETEMALKA